MCVVLFVAVIAEVTLAICLALLGGSILTFIIVALPFRVFQNLTQPERRTVRLWETVWCILAFLSVVYVVILMIISNINLFLFYGVDGTLHFPRTVGGLDMALPLATFNVLFFFYFFWFAVAQSRSRQRLEPSPESS